VEEAKIKPGKRPKSTRRTSYTDAPEPAVTEEDSGVTTLARPTSGSIVIGSFHDDPFADDADNEHRYLSPRGADSAAASSSKLRVDGGGTATASGSSSSASAPSLDALTAAFSDHPPFRDSQSRGAGRTAATTATAAVAGGRNNPYRDDVSDDEDEDAELNVRR
jgi:hypothetical protein